jgi:hypothetical protein
VLQYFPYPCSRLLKQATKKPVTFTDHRWRSAHASGSCRQGRGNCTGRCRYRHRHTPQSLPSDWPPRVSKGRKNKIITRRTGWRRGRALNWRYTLRISTGIPAVLSVLNPLPGGRCVLRGPRKFFFDTVSPNVMKK